MLDRGSSLRPVARLVIERGVAHLPDFANTGKGSVAGAPDGRKVAGVDARISCRTIVRRHWQTLIQIKRCLVVDPRSSNYGHGAEPGADVAAWLARHGVKVTVQRDVASDSDVRNVILSRTADHGVDLIVMGACTAIPGCATWCRADRSGLMNTHLVASVHHAVRLAHRDRMVVQGHDGEFSHYPLRASVSRAHAARFLSLLA